MLRKEKIMSAQLKKQNELLWWNPIPKCLTIWQGTTWFVLPLVLFLIFTMLGSRAFAQCGSCSSGSDSRSKAKPMVSHEEHAYSSLSGGTAQHQHESMPPQNGPPEISLPAPEIPLPSMGGALKGPHGGQLSLLQKHQAEVVFSHTETRIYLYSGTGEPLTTRGVQGNVVMKIRSIDKVYRYALQEDFNVRDGSFLLVRVNASQLNDGDMEATFELTGLPFMNERNARFVQTYALAQPAVFPPPAAKPQQVDEVRQVAITATDRPSIDRQKVCPVTEEPLGSMGEPIKLMVGNQQLFVCCGGCIDQVKSNPAAVLAKLNL
jgi:hypothetical protein